jgi:hypothetical protein
VVRLVDDDDYICCPFNGFDGIKNDFYGKEIDEEFIKNCLFLTHINLSFSSSIHDMSIQAISQHSINLIDLNIDYCHNLTGLSLTYLANSVCLKLQKFSAKKVKTSPFDNDYSQDEIDAIEKINTILLKNNGIVFNIVKETEIGV